MALEQELNERLTTHTFISHFARYDYGSEPFITINAFSMGAWATGINMGIALQRNGIVKNTGPDVDKILKSVREQFAKAKQQPKMSDGYLVR